MRAAFRLTVRLTMSEKIILVWFRNDLRIRDNEILFEAVRKGDKVLPVFCFDPFYFKKDALGNSKTGNLRTRFLIESVDNLRKNLRNLGGELIIRIGNPAEVLPLLAEQYQVNEVYHHREVAYEETEISGQVEAALWKMKLNLKHFIGHTLYHKEDLPFPIKDIPDSFAVFKKKVERDSDVRPCIGTPESVITPKIDDVGELPSLAQLGLIEPAGDSRLVNKFTGGEDAAMEQLERYLLQNEGHALRNNRAVHHSMLSPWLAMGCISLRQVYWAISGNQPVQGNLVILDLLWRDYFRFMFKKHGQKFIAAKETSALSAEIAANQDELFATWKNGETGEALIDAIMHKLNATGYISNYKRQLVATYLINDLKVGWAKGAAYFEEKLIDYSPASNLGNWAFIAGVNDARESRYQVAAKQFAETETKSDFIDTWLPAVTT